MRSNTNGCTYVRTHVQTCIQTCKHTYINTYMHTYIHTHIRTYIHAYIALCVFISCSFKHLQKKTTKKNCPHIQLQTFFGFASRNVKLNRNLNVLFCLERSSCHIMCSVSFVKDKGHPIRVVIGTSSAQQAMFISLYHVDNIPSAQGTRVIITVLTASSSAALQKGLTDFEVYLQKATFLNTRNNNLNWYQSKDSPQSILCCHSVEYSMAFRIPGLLGIKGDARHKWVNTFRMMARKPLSATNII